MQFTAELHTLRTRLDHRPALRVASSAHKAWLDPDGVEFVVTDLVDSLASDFANWLNHQLRTPLLRGRP